MTTTGWVIFVILILVLVVLTTQFSRLLLLLLRMHRDERREHAVSTNQALSTLTEAIREASGKGTTNIFHGAVDHNQTVGGESQGNQVANNNEGSIHG